MKMLNAVGTVFLGVTLLVGHAFAASSNSIAPSSLVPVNADSKIAKEYGKSLPPLAYVAFCARTEGQSECNTRGSVERLIMTSDKMDQLNQVNKYVNTKIKPMSDMDQYGVPDYWTYPVTAGDCEDYQLLKKCYLVQLGFAADELLMTVVFDENGDGHAVLTVMAQDSDYILDNRRNEILPWSQTGYKFLKRESQQNPRQWVSLRQSAPQILVGSKTQ